MNSTAPATVPDPIPTSYVVITTPIVCDCCSRTSHNQEFFAETILRSHLMGKPVVNLKPLRWPAPEGLYDLPIHQRTAPPRRSPFCHLCNSPSLAMSPGLELPPALEAARAPFRLSVPPMDAREAPKAHTTPRQDRPVAKPKTLDEMLSVL